MTSKKCGGSECCTLYHCPGALNSIPAFHTKQRHFCSAPEYYPDNTGPVQAHLGYITSVLAGFSVYSFSTESASRRIFTDSYSVAK